MYFFGRRYYLPSSGRFLTPDPAGFADGSNLYAYVHNNPLTLIDPYGLLTTAEAKDVGKEAMIEGVSGALRGIEHPIDTLTDRARQLLGVGKAAWNGGLPYIKESFQQMTPQQVCGSIGRISGEALGAYFVLSPFTQLGVWAARGGIALGARMGCKVAPVAARYFERMLGRETVQVAKKHGG